MQAFAAVALVLQDNGTLIQDVHSIMIAEWVLAVCVLLVVIGLLGAVIAVFLVVRNVQKKIDKLTKDAQAKAMPLIGQGQKIMGKVQEVVTDLQPKIASVTSDVTHISGVVKERVDHISGVLKEQVDHINGIVTEKADEIGHTVSRVNTTVQDVNSKTQSQVQRVNGMVSEALSTTEQVSRSIQHGIRVPVDKVVGWVAAAKASIESLAEKVPFLQDLMTHEGTAPASPARPQTGTSTVGPNGTHTTGPNGEKRGY